VIPSLSAWLGLPGGSPDAVLDVAAFRYLLLMAGLLWVVEVALERRAASLVAGALFSMLAIGFWCLALQRPFGVFAEAGATQRAAEIAVASASGVVGASPVIGEAAAHLGWQALAAWGLPRSLVQVLPTALAVTVLPLLALAVGSLWSGGERGRLGAGLILAFSTGALEAARGRGFVPGLWDRPGTALLLVALLAMALGAVRLLAGRPAGVLLAAGLLCGWSAAPGTAPLTPTEAFRAMTLDQGLWLPLGALGLWRRPDRAALALVLTGGALSLGAAAGAAVDSWGSLALFRFGLLLAATGPLSSLADGVGAQLLTLRPLSRARLAARPLGLAGLLAVTLPGSFLAWWDPAGLDPVAAQSLTPVSSSIEASASWIASETSPGSVLLASPAYTPQLVVRTGRRVLRWPEVAEPPDEARRVRAERLLLASRPLPEWVADYGVDYVFAAPGDFAARGVASPEELAARAGLELAYADSWRFHVYRVLP